MSHYYFLAIVVAFLIVAFLAFYAGKLLFALKAQTRKQNLVRQKRIDTIVESIQTIALAMEQQQCNFSEGAIRLVNLLESLPVESPPKCENDYPALFELFIAVRDLPTHQERANLSREVRKEQDDAREEQEAKLESKILTEVALLRSFTV